MNTEEFDKASVKQTTPWTLRSKLTSAIHKITGYSPDAKTVAIDGESPDAKTVAIDGESPEDPPIRSRYIFTFTLTFSTRVVEVKPT